MLTVDYWYRTGILRLPTTDKKWTVIQFKKCEKCKLQVRVKKFLGNMFWVAMSKKNFGELRQDQQFFDFFHSRWADQYVHRWALVQYG